MVNRKAVRDAPTEASIAATIQLRLKAKRMSKLQLSTQTGISYPTICRRVDTGKNIMLEELSLIAQALDADVRDFLTQPSTTGGDGK